jgi:fucose 4-O-acetylase-like acetyltransferase
LSNREKWADAVKAGCIFLIVLGHATGLMHMVDGAVPSTATEVWKYATQALAPVRVPLFFLISGYFASRALRRPWRTVSVTRLANYYYLYAIWLVILVMIFTFAIEMTWPSPAPDYSPSAIWWQLLIPGWQSQAVNHLWYLWSLAFFFLLTKATISWSPIMAVVLALVVNQISAFDWQPVPDLIAANLLFFVIGARLPELVKWCASKSRASYLILAAAGYVAIAGVTKYLGIGELPAAATPLSFLGIFVAIRLLAAATRWTPLARGSAWLGSRTLPVYVMHLPLLALTAQAASLVVPEGEGARTAFFLVFPFAAAVIALAAAVGIHAVVSRIPVLRYLFVFPLADKTFSERHRALGVQNVQRTSDIAAADANSTPSSNSTPSTSVRDRDTRLLGSEPNS